MKANRLENIEAVPSRPSLPPPDDALAVLEDSSARGIQLGLDGDKPDELLAAITRHKAEIVLYLQGVADYEVAEAEYQRQLAELRAANARVYANPTPWRCK